MAETAVRDGTGAAEGSVCRSNAGTARLLWQCRCNCSDRRCRGRYLFRRGWSYRGNGTAFLEVMLTDSTGADRVYIACGYTELRRGIDGLVVLVQQQFNLAPLQTHYFCSVVDAETGLRRCTGKAMDLFYCANVWSLVHSSGLGKKAKPEPSLHSNITGSWRA